MGPDYSRASSVNPDMWEVYQTPVGGDNREEGVLVGAYSTREDAENVARQVKGRYIVFDGGPRA